jgi:peptide/nickel transport system permease protein
MIRFVLRRALLLVVVVWGVISLSFVMTTITGDPLADFGGVTATREQMAEYRKQLGLDRPLWEQYADYVLNAARGDFGTSFRHREPAGGLVLERMPATLSLAAAGIALSILLAFPAGILAAIHRDTAIEALIKVGALIGQAMPSFWLGLLLIWTFGVLLRWLPVGGGGDVAHLILPAVTVAAYPLARNVRLLRSAMLEELGLEYVTTARAKGLRNAVVISRHVMRNALISVITFIAIDFGALLGGAVIVETVFGWPGVGRLTVQAIQQRDFPVIQAGVAALALTFVCLNLLADLTYGFLDPRIRFS